MLNWVLNTWKCIGLWQHISCSQTYCGHYGEFLKSYELYVDYLVGLFKAFEIHVTHHIWIKYGDSSYCFAWNSKTYSVWYRSLICATHLGHASPFVWDKVLVKRPLMTMPKPCENVWPYIKGFTCLQHGVLTSGWVVYMSNVHNMPSLGLWYFKYT